MSTCVFVACCLHSLVTETFRRRALTASVDSYKEFPFSGVTNSDSLDEGGGKRCPGCGIAIPAHCGNHHGDGWRRHIMLVDTATVPDLQLQNWELCCCRV